MVDSIENLRKQKDILTYLAQCKKNIRKAILKNADKELIDAICQCVFNLLRGNIQLSETEKQNLGRYKNTLRSIVGRSLLKVKKNILVQQGGFLQFLIPAAITGISQIISSIISNKE